MDGFDVLRFHGDVDAAGARLDFAVNVRGTAPPLWLRRALEDELTRLGEYPSRAAEQQARAEIARMHGVPASHVLLLAGAAEGFSLLPQLLAPQARAVVVHPSFTEPEYALRAAEVGVQRLLLDAPYTLPPDFTRRVAGADMVVVGNPTNPTGVLHDLGELPQATTGYVVVDEAFMDVARPGFSLASAVLEHPRLVVLRSLTKTWALAGLRCGYVLAQPQVLAQLAARRAHWPLGSLQIRALSEVARHTDQVQQIAAEIAEERAAMRALLETAGFSIAAESEAPFILVRPPGQDPEGMRLKLLKQGIAVRRCDTFPGLDQGFWRLAVRGVDAVQQLLEEYCP